MHSERIGALRIPRWVRHRSRRAPSANPKRGLAIITCMDARISVERSFGLQVGDANIIRNAGGLATEDALRSLVVRQHLLETRRVVVLQHTDCGMLKFQDGEIAAQLVARFGLDTQVRLLAFRDLEESVLNQVSAIRNFGWIHPDTDVVGAILDIRSGSYRTIT